MCLPAGIPSTGGGGVWAGLEGGPRGPGEATYVKFFILSDDFCVGNDGRRLTSEELVGWKSKGRVADVKLGVKAATAVLVLSTTDIRANPPSPQAEGIGKSATSPLPLQTLQRWLQVFVPQSSFLQFLTPNRKQIFVSLWRYRCPAALVLLDEDWRMTDGCGREATLPAPSGILREKILVTSVELGQSHKRESLRLLQHQVNYNNYSENFILTACLWTEIAELTNLLVTWNYSLLFSANNSQDC